jgi:hypothetical protein
MRFLSRDHLRGKRIPTMSSITNASICYSMFTSESEATADSPAIRTIAGIIVLVYLTSSETKSFFGKSASSKTEVRA